MNNVDQMLERSDDIQTLISIIVPVFNEEDGLNAFFDQLMAVITQQDYDFEIIFVNDGSTDSSLYVLKSLHEQDNRLKIVDLSRNFGHQNALTAGMDYAKGDAIILMDVDGEDDPKCISAFLNHWKNGYEVVYARRAKRSVSWIKKICFNLFHKLNAMMCPIIMDAAGIFCLMDQRAVHHLKKLSEKDRYIPGLRAWIGFKQIGIEWDRGQRYDGRPRVTFHRLFKLAFDSFFSFSTVPLKISIFMGILFSLISFIGILAIVLVKLFTDSAIPGWASILSMILLVGGVQLICVGLQGEYLIRVFNEVKNRPNYIVQKVIGFEQ